MTKYTFLVYHKQYIEFLEKIREIGVLHVIEKPEGIPENDALREKMLLSARIKIALKQLEKRLSKEIIPLPADSVKDGLEVLINVENKLAQKESLEQKLQQIEKERDRMEVWGIFSFERLHQLREAGYIINFFSCNVRKFDQEWEVIYNAFEIDTVGSTRYFITITRPGEVVDIDADPIKLSDRTAPELDLQIAEIRKEIEEVKQQLIKMAMEDYNTLKSFQVETFETIDFTKVVLNTEPTIEEKVMLIEGWCPEDSEEELQNFLNDSEIYYETSEPTREEKVPVKLKNNRFARAFEFIGNLYDLPHYFEIDLTPFFAPFYMLFFGICLGDAAYGLLLVLFAIFLRKKVNDAIKPVLSLMICLGISTVIMGIITGTFFGFNLIEAEIPWLEKLKKIMIDSNQLFYISLILGIIQILFGMIIKAVGKVLRYGWPASLSTWGWLSILIGCGGTFVLNSYVGLPFAIARWLYIIFGGIGVIFVFLLNNIRQNPLINIGSGLWDTYNMATGLLGDTLSYIRLFALGISGAVMGFVFNDLAINISKGIPFFGPIVMIIIMLIGHSINIFMSGLGAFVHPMRLTFVEFYKNAGFEGGGKKYKPFAHYKEEKSII